MISLTAAAMISKTKIETLRPEFQTVVKLWYQKMLEDQIFVYIYEGFRTNARQTELYCQGRSLPGKIVTNAMAGQSFHNYGLAFDWVPLVRADKASNMYEADWDGEESYMVGRKYADKFNLRYLSWETPHLEDASYANWRELKDKFGSSTPS